MLLSLPLLAEYLREGFPFPTAVLSASMMLSALLSFVCGLILDNVTCGRQETKRLAYLSIPAPCLPDDHLKRLWVDLGKKNSA